MKKISVLFMATIVALGFSTWAAAPDDEILGIWHTTDDKSQVQIFKEHGKYFAKIISLKKPNWPADDPQAGRPKNDRLNPQRELRQRPIVGMQFMNDFGHTGDNLWSGGRIYDPESGKTYKCKISLIGKDRLEVRGYVGVSLLGRTVVWTRQVSENTKNQTPSSR
jgi:uncharacterized protein (DUF2147 family)